MQALIWCKKCKTTTVSLGDTATWHYVVTLRSPCIHLWTFTSLYLNSKIGDLHFLSDFNVGEPGSIPGLSIWNLWCSKWPRDRVFSRYFGFPLSVFFYYLSILMSIQGRGRREGGGSGAVAPGSRVEGSAKMNISNQENDFQQSTNFKLLSWISVKVTLVQALR